MDLAAAAAGARGTRMSLLWAGWSSWRTWAEANPRLAESRSKRTERLRYHRERADASVRRTGLRATTCQSQGPVPGILL